MLEVEDLAPPKNFDFEKFFLSQTALLSQTEFKSSNTLGVKFHNHRQLYQVFFTVNGKESVIAESKSKHKAVLIRYRAELLSRDDYFTKFSSPALYLQALLKT